MATGQARLLSEQQLMDCAWDYGVNQARARPLAGV